MKKVDAKFVFYLLLYFVCCYFASKLALLGLGEVGKDKYVVSLFLLLTFLCSSGKAFVLLVLPLSIIVSFYAPVGMEFGPPNYQGIISVYATDVEEAFAFLSLIDVKTYLKSGLIVILPLISYYLSRVFNIKPWKNKLFLFVVLIALVAIIKPTNVVSNIRQANEEVSTSIENMKKYANVNSWQEVSSSSRNTDYILVIGESARRDYFHIYGYPIGNTPFLDKVPGVFVNGLTSGGCYTIASLSLMLTHGNINQWEARYDYNFIDLAKSAGIGTTWISNQGFIGKWDTPISSIATRSDKIIFPNMGSYDNTRISDFKLLDFLKVELAKERQSSHLYVLHTIGSHPDACDKIDDLKDSYKVNDSALDYVACYISSIRKTDRLLNLLYDQMKINYKNTGRKFSILYFSDHGLVHIENNGGIIINNNKVSKFHYDIPLVKLDSDMSERIIINSRKSGLLFTSGLASWMQIKTPQIPVYDLFDGVDDSDDFGLSEKLKKIDLQEDPAIDISDNLLR